MRNISWIFVIVLFYHVHTPAQENRQYKDFYAEIKFNYGFIVPHHESMRYLQRGHIPSYQLRIGKTTNGKHNWEHLYRYPSWGIGYYFTDLQYPQVLGSVSAIYSFIDIPVYILNRTTFFYKFSSGIAFLSKHFDPDNNYYNIAIGSHENVFLNIGIGNAFKLTDIIDLTGEIGLTHYSNGSIAQPNLGINVASCGLGLRCYPWGKSKKVTFSEPGFRRSNEFVVIVSGGWKKISPSITRNYITSSLSAGIERSLSKKKRTGLGVDLFYDASITRYMEHEKVGNIYRSDNFRPGMHITFDMIFGDVSFTIQWGYYLFVRWNDDGDFYHRFGLKYYFNDHFIANLTIKTHFSKADFIEWGIGYRIPFKLPGHSEEGK